MRRTLRILSILLAVTILAATRLQADDSDIFTALGVQPNVLIMFDNSSSMNDPPSSCTGSCPSKLTSAKSAMTSFVTNLNGVRLGMMKFRSHGASMVTPLGPIETTRATVLTAISNLSTGSVGTPLGDSLYDCGEYYKGLYPGYSSPIQYECQKNYVILVTDGLPNLDDRDPVSNVSQTLRTTDCSGTLPGTQNVFTHTIGFDIAAAGALLQTTATNGGGAFYTAANEAELVTSLQTAISSIVADAYSFTAPLIPTTSVGGGTRAYFSSFQPDGSRPFWRGYLSAYTRNSAGLIPTLSDGTPDPAALAWEAGAVLAAKAPSTRTIFTNVAGVRQDFLKTNANITAALVGLTTTSDRDKLVDFVRGIDSYDEDGDGNVTEVRAWKLGDIYHSAPVLVGPPPLKESDTTYDAYRTAQAGRTKILLVGANDGMLHAFRESDGDELWAFIPPDLLPKLKNMRPTEPAHTSFVDGSPIVTDIKVGATWKTIAIFGERRGGRSYHALDITDTTSPTYLWSFTDGVMGETWSEPAVGRIKMSDNSVKFVAFVGGGYDTANNNATGDAVFAIDLATGTKLWQYVTSSADAAHLNFSVAAPPAVADLDGNGYLDRVYVGDVGGQLWKFDVSAAATLTGSLVNNWPGKRLFVASPAQANPPPAGDYFPTQAIYGRPALAYDSNQKLWVYFGTGDRNHPGDASSNRFYAILDDTTMAQGSALTESSLLNASAVLPSITQGWYLPMASREKVLDTAQVYNSIVYFSTYTANLVASCTTPGGVAQLYAVHMGLGDAAFDWTTGTDTPGENSGTRSTTVGSGIPSGPQVVQGTTVDAVVVSTTQNEIRNRNRPPATAKRLRFWKETY